MMYDSFHKQQVGMIINQEFVDNLDMLSISLRLQ